MTITERFQLMYLLGKFKEDIKKADPEIFAMTDRVLFSIQMRGLIDPKHGKKFTRLMSNALGGK